MATASRLDESHEASPSRPVIALERLSHKDLLNSGSMSPVVKLQKISGDLDNSYLAAAEKDEEDEENDDDEDEHDEKTSSKNTCWPRKARKAL